MSSLVKNWRYVKSTAAASASLEDEVPEELTIYPDQFPISDDTMGNSVFGGILLRRRMFGLRGTRNSRIGNDLQKLPSILQQNIFSCITASEEGEPAPVCSGLEDLCRRVSTIRLRHQADQRGLLWNPKVPWMLAPRETYMGKRLAQDAKSPDGSSKCDDALLYGNPLDLVPEPCDWIPYDVEMSQHPRPCGPRFNTKDYSDFYWEQYSQFSSGEETPLTNEDACCFWKKRDGQDGNNINIQSAAVTEGVDSDTVEESGRSESLIRYDSDRAWKLLVDTALTLKEGGNAAFGAGAEMEAARRYDQAIKYCAVGLLVYPNANQDFLDRAGHKWCPLRRILVTARLNLCMVLSNFDLKGAKGQAVQALRELEPYCTEEGKVVVGKKHGVVYNQDEPASTYQETKELLAKAFFRLGSVSYKIGDYDEAVENFEESIKTTKEISKTPDFAVLRRLAEAKREKALKNKRQKKKFKRMLAQDTLGDDEALGKNGGS